MGATSRLKVGVPAGLSLLTAAENPKLGRVRTTEKKIEFCILVDPWNSAPQYFGYWMGNGLALQNSIERGAKVVLSGTEACLAEVHETVVHASAIKLLAGGAQDDSFRS